MSRYVVQARRFAGSLDAPTRNDTDSADAEDYREAVGVAEGMSARGWSVWLYEDQHHTTAPSAPFDPLPVPSGSRWRVVAEWRANGSRVR